MTPSESTPESGRKTDRKLAMTTPGSPDDSGGETVIRRRGKSSYKSYLEVKALPSLLPSASASSSRAVSSSSTTGPPRKVVVVEQIVPQLPPPRPLEQKIARVSLVLHPTYHRHPTISQAG